MSNGYTPNEKNYKMFGSEQNGYTMERVDNYLFQLESAYMKLKEKYDTLRVEVENTPPPPLPGPDEATLEKIRDLEENNRKLREAAEAIRSANTYLKDKVQDLTDQLNAIPPQPEPRTGEEYELIAKTLIDARVSAEDIIRSARIEAENVLRDLQRRNDVLREEGERARKQLQGLCYSINSVLRESEVMDASRGGPGYAD